jgi:hypothetical protein
MYICKVTVKNRTFILEQVLAISLVEKVLASKEQPSDITSNYL